MGGRIVLVPIGFSDMRLLGKLSDELARIFPARVEVGALRDIPTDAGESRRNQYNATLLLRELEAEPADEVMILGITGADLFSPGLSFVFGQASPRKQAAIVSTARLRPPEDRDDSETLFLRLVKEAVHEIGHLYRLGHCPDPDCVMHYSNTLADTDRKSVDFCLTCGTPAD